MGCRSSLCEEENWRDRESSGLPTGQQSYQVRCLPPAKYIGSVQISGRTCLVYRVGHVQWVLGLAEESRELTAVPTPLGQYRFNVLPFGIKNSPAECQRALENALEGVPNCTKYTLTMSSLMRMTKRLMTRFWQKCSPD
eukprot:Blabericola_migrator_1__7092@NODE_3599_length_1650_cov_2_168667_g2235_i0_p1_GENE_NODE_3599_length_1650_cov_2_168667_g2235_i0NODE_3599_length_1650_cov_2_168667_g2235_i0_p1_ORF_typecomplete_len139_score7_90_NODE_3599_length_1650_cov_2_168667_g2235_i09701386